MLTNKERGEMIKRSICKPGATDLPVCNTRSTVLDAFKGTDVSGSKVCDAYAPLNRDRKVTQEDIDELNDLADQVRDSDDPRLTSIGELVDMTLI
ncbi:MULTISPECIES: hypothetical protein [unclassified Pseudomonas]|uniref:hypothetical protein n=1 Tax=unclassified Pseudomonas TaxID=196821 RepID=UPI002096A1BC|nr:MULTISPECIES: hypothetical protein [unclassified Pseudomonas]MCO7519301.1 hypothetical protein [Pseudomonas sp. 1]MCO7541716.1 hypothetical protein [Pseudomonas sp. VA159-2]